MYTAAFFTDRCVHTYWRYAVSFLIFRTFALSHFTLGRRRTPEGSQLYSGFDTRTFQQHDRVINWKSL